jgi:hypothetical protein
MPTLDTRTAACQCGQLSIRCEGEPVKISVCHCRNCRRRSGSAFAHQARWPDDKVTVTGEHRQWSRTGDSGSTAVFSFCPACGGGVFYTLDVMPGLTAVAVGGFADPAFPPPEYSVYESRKSPWVEIVGEGIDHLD